MAKVSRMRGVSTQVPAMPRSYLQVVAFLHVEVQPVLQLFQVLGFLQDTLPLAKSLQATCFPAMHKHSPGFTGLPHFHPSAQELLYWRRAGKMASRASSNISGDPVSCLTASGALHTHHGCTSESYRCSGDGDGL